MNAVTLDSLAADINREHKAAIAHARSAVQRARHAGELLLQAKEQTQHGEWLPWLAAHCPDISERTVQGYMRLARHCLADPAMAAQIESLTLREALVQLSEPKAAEIPQLEAPNARRVADLPVTAATTFDPFTFKRRLAQLDENIDRAASVLFANFKVDTDGLSRFERKEAWLAALNHAPADIPLIPGYATLGSIGDNLVIVLFESREHPGYWHDIDLRHGSASKRPVKPLGLAWRFADAPAHTWTTEPDDGQFLAFVERTQRAAS